MFTYYRDGTLSFPGADAPRVYVRAWKLCRFHSLTSTQTFRGALTASVNSRADKECPFSGVSNSGRGWRKVPESDVPSVPTRLTERQLQTTANRLAVPVSPDALNEYSMLKLAELPVVRRGREREEAGFMMAETVALLKEFYSPFLIKLADMLDDEKWLFPKTDIPVAAPRNVDTEEEGNNEPPPSQTEPEADKDEEAEKAPEEEVAPKEEEPEKPKSEEERTTEEGGEDI